MASPALTRVGEARLAGAIARLLRWEARLLARPTHDAASRSAALRGLEWAADFARALDAESCAEWLDALRDRASERPGHTPLVWSALGADACADVAAQLESHHTLVPLAPGARGWRAMAAAVRDYAEPAEGAPASASEPAADTPAEILAEPAATAIDLSTAPFRFGDRGRVPVGTRVAGDPGLVREFASALADWVGPYGIHVDARNGRVELSGARPSDHAEPGRLSDSALEALRLLHLAAGRIAAPLLVADPAEGAVSWSVRLPAAEGGRHLFVEAGAQRLALPWHAVVTYGLADSGRPHVVLGRGLERIALGLDWLHGLGPGKPVDAPPIEAIAFDSPALLALPQVLEADDGGRFALVEVLPVLPTLPETEAEAPAEPVPAPEAALEEPAPPADNPGEVEPPPAALVALVADDSFTARVFLSRMLAMRGIAVDEAEDGHEARARLAGRRYDLVFLDADMPGGGALALAPSIAADVLDVAVVLVRDDGERAAAQAAGFGYALYKPFAEDEVAAALRALAEESRPGA